MWMPPWPEFETTLIDAPSGNAGALYTVATMRAMIDAAKLDPFILNFARRLIFLEVQKDQRAEVDAIFEWVQKSIRYTQDPVGVETVAIPHRTIDARCGDCDDQTALLGALLEAVGYPTRIVLAAYTQDRDFEHVYLQVLYAGEWVDADPIMHDKPLGFAASDPLLLWIEKR